MSSLHSCLFEGLVMHHRFQPARHRFVYRVFSLCVDLDELPALNRLRFFSLNRFNLFSIHEKDHGGGDGELATQIRKLLTQHGYADATQQIRLLCYPRILGYTFNPLSVYFCYDSEQRLRVILYEVSNTFGSRHTYLIEVDRDDAVVRHGTEKLMYVSPFMPMETRYQFRIRPPADDVAVCIRQLDQTTADAILHATFSGKRRELSDAGLLSAFVRYPLMTLKVIAAIHWEALMLWRKNLKIQPRTKGRTQTMSWQDKEGVTHHESI